MEKNKVKKDTSWQAVGKWYDNIVGEMGHHYHQTVIMPNLLKIIDSFSLKTKRLLDVACGQGVLARNIKNLNFYCGIDLSSTLINQAKSQNRSSYIEFHHADATKPFPIEKKDFNIATCILAIQNIDNPQAVFENINNHLEQFGKFILVINHPSFRIPRQSSWQTDETNKIQYRRINRYMTSLEIPIQMHPGKNTESETTWSYHHPLSSYSKWLYNAGFKTLYIDEWISNKISTGLKAKMENRAREEFPLFLTIVAEKT